MLTESFHKDRKQNKIKRLQRMFKLASKYIPVIP